MKSSNLQAQAGDYSSRREVVVNPSAFYYMEKSHGHLKRLYKKYNEVYFGGFLPDVAVRWDADVALEDLADCGMGDGQIVIRLNPYLRPLPPVYKLYLLHEMCHVKLYPAKIHNAKFHAEMERLSQAGAFKDLW